MCVVTHDWINSAVCHREPIESQINIFDIWRLHYLGIMVGVQEVDVIGEPAHSKDSDDHHEHLDDLSLVLPALDGAVCEFSRSVPPKILA